MVGTRLRPHCSHAACAMARQCACFFAARSPERRSTPCCVCSGAMRATPSSVAFSTSQSMRSFAGMPMASVTSRAASRSMASCASTRTATSLRPMRRTRAVHWPPWPLNSVISSPGCRRSTCTWRAAPGGSASSAPGASVASQKKRGM
ncbi:hypothetical protein Q5W_19430 [Hydrogenophaga sp. PBC]|nr:hypothetical protein Q5W_19430 [Hydrogenophaga sp. PBC]